MSELGKGMFDEPVEYGDFITVRFPTHLQRSFEAVKDATNKTMTELMIEAAEAVTERYVPTDPR